MALRDPVPVFNADTNVEAQLVRTLLVDAGIEAFVVEDVSYVGTWPLGTLPEINKPQVWVERADVAKACEFLDDYDRPASQHQQTAKTGEPFCYHCGEEVKSSDSACAACGQPLDWPTGAEQDGRGDVARIEGVVAGDEEADDTIQHGGLAGLRTIKKPLAWLYLASLAGQILLLIIGVLVGIVVGFIGWFR